MKIPEFINKKHTSYFNIFSVFHASFMNSFLQKEQLIINNLLMIPSICLTFLVPLRRINLFTVWNVVAMISNGETKRFPVSWNMTSGYNGVLNNNASKTNKCPEKPYNNEKNVLLKHPNTTIIHNLL